MSTPRFALPLRRQAVCAIALFAAALLLHALVLPPVPRKGERPRAKEAERVYLLHADNLRYDEYARPGAQCLSGHVAFTHKGMTLRCDSAVLYQATNSFEAYGNVHLTQGDTLSLTGDRLYYRGDDLMAEMRSRVVMKHHGQTLHTDSLNYDRLYSLAYYFDGGRLIDGDNVLTSDWGEYHTDTRRALFNYRVELTNPRFRLVTDTLHYDTQTKWAETKGPANVYSGTSRIYTQHGYYNTQSEQMKLFDRSHVFGRESELQGDSLFYNKATGEMTALRNVVYHDTKNKTLLLGDYCRYNELTGEALAHDSALAKDYSNPRDTLYVHADTLRLHTYHMNTDSVQRLLRGYYHVRAYRTQVQVVADSLVFDSRARTLSLFRDPIVWSDARQILGEEINVHMNDSTIDSVYVQRQALLVERVDSAHFNQVSARLMRSYFEGGDMRLNCADGNVCIINFPLERDSTVLYQNYTETGKLRMYFKERKMQRVWMPAATGLFYAAGTAPAEHTWLPSFAWFDYIRPLSKDDLYAWRGKKKGTELKQTVRRQPPVQTFTTADKAVTKTASEP